jgi:ABC-type transporter Mla subunit MlaD
VTRLQSWLLVSFAGALTLAAILTLVDLHLTQVETRTAEAAIAKAPPDLGPTVDKLNTTIDKANALLLALNAPCTDFQGNYSCGPILTLAQTEKNIGILAGKSAQQVQQSATLINAAATGIRDVSASAKGALDQGTETLKQVNDKETGVGATLAKVNGQLDALKAWENSPEVQADVLDVNLTLGEVKRFSVASANSMENVQGITADIHTETTKMTQPKTKEQKIMEWAPVAVKGAISIVCVVFGPC